MATFSSDLHLDGIGFAAQAVSRANLLEMVETLMYACGHPHNFVVVQSDLRLLVSEMGAECLADARVAVAIPILEATRRE